MESVLTPIELIILLHYYYSAEEFKHEIACFDAINDAHLKLRNRGLLEVATKDTDIESITDKGTCYVKAILATPLPVAIWVLPIAK